MGYRSVVSFCLEVKEPEKFVALLKLKDSSIVKEMLEHMYMEEGLIHFYADHWKWYEESESTFNDIMNMAEEYDEDFNCRFARFGEESDDIEEQAFGENGWDLDYPYVVRDIQLGFDIDTAKKLID